MIEALYAGALDLAYVGPNPAVAGYVRSKGEALRVIAGATSGGVALVVRTAAGIQKPDDFHGKKIATPQLGNTQDVALRAWLQAHQLRTREKGGDVLVIPIANPDQLTLFLKGEIDAAWAPEPWASRLIQEANARLLVDERTAAVIREQILADDAQALDSLVDPETARRLEEDVIPDEGQHIRYGRVILERYATSAEVQQMALHVQHRKMAALQVSHGDLVDRVLAYDA